ncbi:MAG: MFS transporter [Burkholderiales bacterium]|nr:MFS transporter [Burkholderiales bacterium]
MSAWKQIPRPVWVLGFVSLFMDMSSELIHAVLPVYMTTVLGVSALVVGVVEGLAEATSSMLKVISGWVSDRFRQRKALALVGYGLAALVKPMFPLAESAVSVATARLLDRVGKGLRGAPRDAMVADVTPAAQLNAAYGLRQSLDTTGAFLGPLLAVLFLWLWNQDLRAVMWIATVPAFIAVGLLAFCIHDAPPGGDENARSLAWREVLTFRGMPRRYWVLMGLAALFSMARMSEAFLVLRAQELQFTLLWIPLVMTVMSVTYAVIAYPAALAATRLGRDRLLLMSLAVLLASEGLMALSPSLTAFWLGVALWGAHMGLSQGILSAAIADCAPSDRRATAFGGFHFVTGVFQLASGVLCGWLWVTWGSSSAFGSGAAWTIVLMFMLSWVIWRDNRR